MGWLDACGKDLSRKDFPSNCLLSSAQLNREQFLGVLVSKGLVQFVYIPFPKARNQVFFFSLHLGKVCGDATKGASFRLVEDREGKDA